jgi:hypothetical protein
MLTSHLASLPCSPKTDGLLEGVGVVAPDIALRGQQVGWRSLMNLTQLTVHLGLPCRCYLWCIILTLSLFCWLALAGSLGCGRRCLCIHGLVEGDTAADAALSKSMHIILTVRPSLPHAGCSEPVAFCKGKSRTAYGKG